MGLLKFTVAASTMFLLLMQLQGSSGTPVPSPSHNSRYVRTAMVDDTHPDPQQVDDTDSASPQIAITDETEASQQPQAVIDDEPAQVTIVDMDRLKWSSPIFGQIRRRIRDLYDGMDDVTLALAGGEYTPDIPTIGFYKRVFQANEFKVVIVECIWYFMCFVEPVADILKNESVRAIIEQRETTFEQEFADALNNLGVARDLYQLMREICLGSGCTIPGVEVDEEGSTFVSCPVIQVPSKTEGDEVYLDHVVAVAYELAMLTLDVLIASDD